jgi:hypothetical protein
MMLKKTLEAMLAAEQSTIKIQLRQVTRDPPLVRAEIRAELLRELLHKLPPDTAVDSIEKFRRRPDWVEPDID